MRLILAIRVFLLVLFRGEVARRVAELLAKPAEPGPEAVPAAAPKPKEPAPAKQKPPARSDAISLLATLQREARFVDFIKEPLAGYSDAQIGAAARQVHRDCGQVLDRLLALRPVVNDAEGAEIEVPADFDAGRCRLTGNVTGQGPFHGRLVHHGWEAETCQLPAWTGNASAARVVAPAEVELK